MKHFIILGSIALVGYSVLNHVALTPYDLLGMFVIVPCVVAVIYRVVTVLK